MTVVVVGAGQAGVQAADSLRSAGYDDRIILLSDESRAPYQRPPLSKDLLVGQEKLSPLPLRTESFFASGNIELRLESRVESIDRRRKLVHLADEVIEYTYLVLATGSQTRRLVLDGHHPSVARIHYLRTFDDAVRLSQSLKNCREAVVVGGGFIGLEFAAVAVRRGIEVTVVTPGARALRRTLSEEMSSWVVDWHRAQGTRFLLNHRVVSVEPVDETTIDGRLLATTSEDTVLEADLMVVGIGADPDLELASAAGLAVDDGIVVDETLRTSDPHIFAIGDCARVLGREQHGTRHESVQNASDQGKHVARSILGEQEAYEAVPWFWTIQGPHKIQIAGLMDAAVKSRRIEGAHQERFSLLHFDADDTLVAVESLNSAADHMAARKLLRPERRPLRWQEVDDPDFTLKGWSKRASSSAEARAVV